MTVIELSEPRAMFPMARGFFLPLVRAFVDPAVAGILPR